MPRRTTKHTDGRARLKTLTRRHSTATVLFHHAIAERLGLGPSDHKCLDLLLQHEHMTGSRLSAMTGLTTGAVTGVVNRLEQAGYVRRTPDPTDGRRQLLQPVPERIAEVGTLFDQHGPDLASMLADMDRDQISAVITFLDRATDDLEQRSAMLRVETSRTPPSRARAKPTPPTKHRKA
ncbi:MAG: MarR family winged helix-turn-helix transcriptional regulator [Nocardioidaceae bacterium]